MKYLNRVFIFCFVLKILHCSFEILAFVILYFYSFSYLFRFNISGCPIYVSRFLYFVEICEELKFTYFILMLFYYYKQQERVNCNEQHRNCQLSSR